MKIAFAFFGSDIWNGGIVYLENLLRALHQTYADQLTLCLIANQSPGAVPDEMRKIIDEVLVYPEIRRWTGSWIVDNISRRLLQHEQVKDLYLRQHGIDLVALDFAPHGSNTPALGWIPDFQHLRLPEMFSVAERQGRDRRFRQMAEQATRVLVLSEAVRRDFQAFTPQYTDKVRVSSPVSIVPSSVYASNRNSVCGLYHLPEKFVYLPSQFWKHKNHLIVLRVLRSLKDKGIQVFLVCSGYPGDYRHPSYFAEVLQESSRLDLRDQVALLGLLPHEQVFQLMRQSVCVLNPSLFEGYGMTVEEARAVGKQVLISDLPAHREQNPPGAIFFNPMDDAELARQLERVWCERTPGPDLEREAEARRTLPERIRRYAEGFMAIVQEVV